MMKKHVLSVIAAATVSGLGISAKAAAFLPSDLVVFQAGSSSSTTAVSSVATADYIDEYTPAGTQVQQILLPTTSSGSATSEGEITTGPTGYLAVPGYNLTAGTAGAAASVPSTTTAQRVVNIIDATGAINASTQLSNAFSGNNIRGAVYDGTNVYAAGTAATASVATAGIQFATPGSTTSTPIESAVSNTRVVNEFGGNLYFSSGSGTGTGTAGIYEVAGTPTATGQTATLIATDALASASPYGFFFTSLTGVGAPTGLNTLYVADSNGTILKYSLVGGAYTLTGSVAITAPTGGSNAVTGLTGLGAGTTADLYFSSPDEIFSYIDTSGYDAAPTNALGVTTVATISNPGDAAFRGIAFAPTAVTVATPEPATLGLAIFGAAGLVGRRRKA